MQPLFRSRGISTLTVPIDLNFSLTSQYERNPGGVNFFGEVAAECASASRLQLDIAIGGLSIVREFRHLPDAGVEAVARIELPVKVCERGFREIQVPDVVLGRVFRLPIVEQGFFIPPWP